MVFFPLREAIHIAGGCDMPVFMQLGVDLERGGMQQDPAIDEHAHGIRRSRDPQIASASSTEPTVPLSNILQRQLIFVLRCHRFRLVARAVVHHDDLELIPGK
jgi:hypothetical protein